MAQPRVLVVEDTDTVRHLIGRVLRGEGYLATFAETGEQALEKLRAESWDLLLTDRSLPGMDGLAVLAEAKRLHPRMPSVLISGYGGGEAERTAREAGAAACLGKPFALSDFREICARLTGRGVVANTAPRAAALHQTPA